MDAGALGRGQVIDAPPTHLQKYKGNEQYTQGETRPMCGYLPVMHIDKIGEPGDGSPCLFGVPRPVMSPSLLSPQGTKEHADGNQRYTNEYNIV